MLPRPTILAFDTSAAHCAAALLRDGQIVSRVEDMAKGQGERLMGLLEDLLAENNTTWADLDGIGVGTGPGNFTGIRIAVSAARGLALGLGIPAVGVSAFDAAAYGLSNVIVCLPAPRDQAYVQAQVSGADQDARLVELPRLKAFPDVPAKAEARFVGPAAQAVGQAYMGRAFGHADVVEQSVIPIEAITWIAAARGRHETKRPAPMYVKPPDAAPSRDSPPVILP